MIKNRTVIEVEINGRAFRLECPSESTWQEVVASLSLMNDFSQERIKTLNPPVEETNKEEAA